MIIFTVIQKIVKILKNITFKNPKRSKILIYDCTGSKILIDTILYDFDYSILPTRDEFLYYSPQILLIMGKKIIEFGFKHPKEIVEYIDGVYFLSCIEYINPKIVITYIDNDFRFQWIAKKYNHAYFYAIQNGVRDPRLSQVYTKGILQKITMPYFVCFGMNDVDNFTKLGHKIDHPICIGSLRGGYYKYGLQKTTKKIQYDICLISEYNIELTKDISMKDFLEAFQKLVNLLKQYMETHNKSVCIALRSLTDFEYEYYSKIFGNKVTIIQQHKNDFFSSYYAMNQSEVILTLKSTAVFEAFGWGGKTIFCNFLNDEISDFYNSGICHISDSSYTIFEDKLNYFLDLPQHEFMELTESQRKYVMNYDSNLPVHLYMRNVIKDLLNN